MLKYEKIEIEIGNSEENVYETLIKGVNKLKTLNIVLFCYHENVLLKVS